MIARTKARVGIDWDDDGFINHGIDPNAPINKIPLASYMANMKQTIISGDKEKSAVLAQDIDELGLIKTQFTLASGDIASLGFKHERFRSVGDLTNILPDFNKITPPSDALTLAQLSGELPGDTAWQWSFSSVGEPHDVELIDGHGDIPVTPSHNYIVVAWVRFTGFDAPQTNDISFELEIKDNAATILDTAGFATTPKSNYTHPDNTYWFQLVQPVTTLASSNTLSSIKINNIQTGSTGGTDGGFFEVSGLQVLDGAVVSTKTDVSLLGDWGVGGATDLVAVENTSGSSPFGTGYVNIETTGTSAAGTYQFVIPIEQMVAGRSYKVRLAIRPVSTSQSIDPDIGYISNNLADYTNLGNPAGGASLTADVWDISVTDAFQPRTAKEGSTPSEIGINYTVAGSRDPSPNGSSHDIACEIEDLSSVTKAYWYEFPNFGNKDATAILSANTGYTLDFSHRSADITGAMTVTIKRFRLGTETVSTIATRTITPSTDWRRESITIPSVAYSSGWSIEITGQVGTIEVKAPMLVEGSTSFPFSSGECAGYDDLSSSVITTDWKLGKNTYDAPLAFEGVATIVLDNDSKLYSPANTASPLYGKFRQNLKVVIDLQNSSGTWVRVWSGWTHMFNPSPGRTSDRKTNIECKQGIFRLREGELNYTISDKINLTDAIRDIFKNVGFRSTYNPFQTVLDFGSKLDETAYIQNIDDIFSEISTTHRSLDGVGIDWGRLTTPESALKVILEAENSKLWMDREGGLVLRHREDFINRTPDHTINLGTDSVNATYEYGKDIVNRVEVTTEPRKEFTDADIWNTKTPISIRGRRKGDEDDEKYTVRRDMQFRFQEGRQRTITKINTNVSSMTVSVYTKDPSSVNDPSKYTVNEAEWVGQVGVSVYGAESLRKQLVVVNRLRYPVWVDVTVTGNYYEGGEVDAFTFNDIVAQNQINAIHSDKIELKEVTSEAQAKSYADFILHRKANPVGEFTAISMLSDDATRLDAMLAIGTGDILDITEEQTGEIARKHIVLGESGKYASGMLVSLEYNLSRIDEQTYYAVGDVLISGIPNVLDTELDNLQVSSAALTTEAVITPEGQTVKRVSPKKEGLIVIGDLSLNSWSNRFQKGRYITGTTTVWQNNDPTSRDNIHSAMHSWERQSVSSATEEIGVDRGVIETDVDFNFPVGTCLWRMSAQARALLTSQYSDMDVSVDVYNNTSPGVEATLLSTTTVNEADGTLRWSNTFTTAKTDEMVLRMTLADNTGVGGVGARKLDFGDLDILHYESLPTDKLALEAGVVHYLQLWGYSDWGGGGRTVNVIILSEDGSVLLSSSLTIPEGFGVGTLQFTPAATKEKKHAIILTPSGSDDLDIYGISVSQQQHTSYLDSIATSNALPLVYI